MLNCFIWTLGCVFYQLLPRWVARCEFKLPKPHNALRPPRRTNNIFSTHLQGEGTGAPLPASAKGAKGHVKAEPTEDDIVLAHSSAKMYGKFQPYFSVLT